MQSLASRDTIATERDLETCCSKDDGTSPSRLSKIPPSKFFLFSIFFFFFFLSAMKFFKYNIGGWSQSDELSILGNECWFRWLRLIIMRSLSKLHLSMMIFLILWFFFGKSSISWTFWRSLLYLNYKSYRKIWINNGLRWYGLLIEKNCSVIKEENIFRKCRL